MITSPNLEDPDGFYEVLVEAHKGLDGDQSAALNARLVLVLANQVGRQSVLEECVRLARNASRG